MDTKRILFAEDDERDVTLALAALADQDLADSVAVVRDGAEALDYLHRRGSYATRTRGLPAVLVMDLRMPGVDGFEVLAELKKDAHLHLLPVVVLTASNAAADVARSYSLGASAFVTKPLESGKLRETISTLAVFWAVNNEPPPQIWADEEPSDA